MDSPVLAEALLMVLIEQGGNHLHGLLPGDVRRYPSLIDLILCMILCFPSSNPTTRQCSGDNKNKDWRKHRSEFTISTDISANAVQVEKVGEVVFSLAQCTGPTTIGEKCRKCPRRSKGWFG